MMVKANDQLSNNRDIVHGVPQGSTLGPFLFIMFVNDMFACVTNENVSIRCYADDTVMSSAASTDDQGNIFNTQIDNIIQYFYKNHLVLNEKKTKTQFFGNQKPSATLNYTFKRFDLVSEYKYLGLTIDNKFSFNKQYKTLYNKLTTFFKYIYNISYYIDKKLIAKIYKSFILPHIEYASISYIYFRKTHFIKLSNINNKILKMTDLDTHEYDIKTRFKITALKYFVKNYNKECHPTLQINFKSDSKYCTRYNTVLPIIKKSIFLKSYHVWCIKIYLLVKNKNMSDEQISFLNIDNLFDIFNTQLDDIFFLS